MNGVFDAISHFMAENMLREMSRGYEDREDRTLTHVSRYREGASEEDTREGDK